MRRVVLLDTTRRILFSTRSFLLPTRTIISATSRRNDASEETVEQRVYLLRDTLEILRIGLKFCDVAVDNQQFPLIILNPLLVPIIQPREVIDTNALLIISPALGNLSYEVWNAASYVYHKIRETHQRHP